jgi:hypothetical protein
MVEPNKDDDTRAAEAEAKLRELGVAFHDGIPVFPFVPDSAIRNTFYVNEAGDLQTDEHIDHLIRQMWLEPESAFYYYFGLDGEPSADQCLLMARDRGDVHMNESERRYYKHPKYPRDFVRIVPKEGGQYNWDWEQKAVETGPEFWRATLRLSQRKREELDAWRKVQIEERFRQEALMQRYAFDVFLSYASADDMEAQSIHDQIVDAGHTVFMAGKSLKPGDDFAEEIRLALHGSREIWLLVSPTSLKSEWVISEWGAGWALSKRIVPILHRCSPESLPPRLARLNVIDLHRCGELIRLLNTVNQASA